jgi:hypothetical protein
MNKLAWIVAVLGLLFAAALVGATAAKAPADRRVGRLAIACFVAGIALALESLFLGQQKVAAELNADRAGSCAEAATDEYTDFGCDDLPGVSEKLSDKAFLDIQASETRSAARRDKSSGLFGDAAKLMIGLALADLFAKRLLDAWKTEPASR